MRKLGFTRTLVVLAAVAASGFAVAALAAPGSNPSKLCKTERADAGFAASHDGKTFAQFYAGNKNQKSAFGKCVAAKAKAKKTTTTATTVTLAPTPTALTPTSEARASAACRTAQADAGFAAAHDGKTFAQFYGTNTGGQNAFGKCVSSKS